MELGCFVERKVGKAKWRLWIGFGYKGEEETEALVMCSQHRWAHWCSKSSGTQYGKTRNSNLRSWLPEPVICGGAAPPSPLGSMTRNHCYFTGFSPSASVELKLTQAEQFSCPFLSVLLSVFCHHVYSIKIDICTKRIWVLTKP